MHVRLLEGSVVAGRHGGISTNASVAAPSQQQILWSRCDGVEHRVVCECLVCQSAKSREFCGMQSARICEHGELWAAAQEG
jgi:hypothetical protein